MSKTDVIDQCRFVGLDGEKRYRVFGTGASPDVAEDRCREAARDYVRRRPDTGPLSNWSFQRTR